jgi:hypothetical protein
MKYIRKKSLLDEPLHSDSMKYIYEKIMVDEPLNAGSVLVT